MKTCPISQRSQQAVLKLRKAPLGAVVFALVLFATAAHAQQPGTGVRAGVSGDPDQFYLGVHVDTGPIFDRLSFRPNLEVGLGNGLTSVAGNFEFVYWWPVRSHPWSIYAGGGPAVNIYRHDAEHGNHTDVQPGFNILLGAAHRGGFFTELKLGLIDSPEVKFGVGYTWR